MSWPWGATDSTTFTGSYIITSGDIDAEKFDNVALATGKGPANDPASDEDDEMVVLPAKPVLGVDKSADKTEIEEPDADVTYTYLITNLSRPCDKVQLTAVSDDKVGNLLTLSAVTWTKADGTTAIDPSTYWLAPGETVKAVVTKHVDVDYATSKTYTNVVTVQGKDDDGSMTDEAKDDWTIDGQGLRASARRPDGREERRPDHASRAGRGLHLHGQGHELRS